MTEYFEVKGSSKKLALYDLMVNLVFYIIFEIVLMIVYKQISSSVGFGKYTLWHV